MIFKCHVNLSSLLHIVRTIPKVLVIIRHCVSLILDYINPNYYHCLLSLSIGLNQSQLLSLPFRKRPQTKEARIGRKEKTIHCTLKFCSITEGQLFQIIYTADDKRKPYCISVYEVLKLNKYSFPLGGHKCANCCGWSFGRWHRIFGIICVLVNNIHLILLLMTLYCMFLLITTKSLKACIFYTTSWFLERPVYYSFTRY